jgi:hypothetical protein
VRNAKETSEKQVMFRLIFREPCWTRGSVGPLRNDFAAKPLGG